MDVRPHLPNYASPFVGRATELEALGQAVSDGQQLITLVGAAGVGKTRLAVQYARSLPHIAADPPAGPVWFCDLAGSSTAPDVCSAVIRALRMPFEAGPPTSDAASRIAHWLKGCGPAVLILNNFEQVVRHASFTVGVWHAAAPEVVFLVTTRQPLRLPHEVRVEVEPFAAMLTPPASTGNAVPNDAAKIFVTAAPAGSVDLTRNDDARFVAEITRVLHGVPLALEITAAALQNSTLAEAAAGLAAPSALLPPSLSPSPALRETESDRAVRRAIDWAATRLSDAERTMLSQASVFVSGFSPEAARAIVRFADGEHASVDDAAAGLIRRKMLRADESADSLEPTRYSFWIPVRTHGERSLADGKDAESVAARHAEYFLSQGEAWANGVHGREAMSTLDRIALEHDNLRAVLKRALAVEEPSEHSTTEALRAVRVLIPLISTRGTLASNLATLDEVINVAGRVENSTETTLFASILLSRAEALRSRGRLDDAVADTERALGLARKHFDPELESRLLHLLGALSRQRGDADLGLDLTRQALEIQRRNGLQRLEGLTVSDLGLISVERGDLASGETLFLEAIEILRAAGDRRAEGIALTHLGHTVLIRGDLPRARSLLDQALEIHRESGSRRFEATTLGYLALVSHLSSQLPAARRGYRLTVAMMREFGDRRLEGYYRTLVALLDLEERKIDAAVKGLRDAQSVLRTARDARIEALTLGAMAAQHALKGQSDDADALLDQCRESLATANDPLLDPALEVFRAICELAQADRARKAGDEASATELVASARGKTSDLPKAHADEVSIALRVFAKYLDLAEPRPGWTLDPHGTWFQAPGKSKTALGEKKILTRIFAELVRVRLADPGRFVSLDDLAAAGFSTTRVVSRSVRNRVNIALRALHSAGLGALIEAQPGGFRLDPNAIVRAGSPG